MNEHTKVLLYENTAYIHTLCTLCTYICIYTAYNIYVYTYTYIHLESEKPPVCKITTGIHYRYVYVYIYIHTLYVYNKILSAFCLHIM